MKHHLSDLRKVWHRIQHERVAKWTLIVHIVYYGHAAVGQYVPAVDTHFAHFITSLVCGVFLTAELMTKDKP